MTLLTLCFIFANSAKIIASQYQIEIVIQQQISKSQLINHNHNKVSVSTVKSGFTLNNLNELITTNICNGSNHYQIPKRQKTIYAFLALMLNEISKRKRYFNY